MSTEHLAVNRENHRRYVCADCGEDGLQSHEATVRWYMESIMDPVTGELVAGIEILSNRWTFA